MEFITKPSGATKESIRKVEEAFGVCLPDKIVDWWQESDGADVYFGLKELQFFSIEEITGEDIYGLKQNMPGSIPICMDGNGNICVAKITQGKIAGYYVASCGDLGWDEAKFIASSFPKFINDKHSPESWLNA